jgi:hypothetical protein
VQRDEADAAQASRWSRFILQPGVVHRIVIYSFLGCWWMRGDGNNISSAGLASMDVRSSWAASHKEETH